MKKYLLLILILLVIPTLSFPAAFTSKATGNWTAAGQTIWNEVGVPGAGDTFTIANAHNVTLNADVTGVAGIVEGSLTLGAFTLTLGGNLTIGNGTSKDGTLTLGPDSRIDFGANNIVLGNCNIVSTASAGHFAVITGTGNIVTHGTVTSPKQNFSPSYTLFDNTGTGTMLVAIKSTTGGVTEKLDVDHCSFFGWSALQIGTAGSGTLNITREITNSDFRNVTDILITGPAGTPVPSPVFTHNTLAHVLASELRFNNVQAWTMTDDVWKNQHYGVGGSAPTTGGHTVTSNFSTSDTSNAVWYLANGQPAITYQDSYQYTAYANPHNFTVSGTGGSGTHTIRRNVFENIANGDAGNILSIGTLAVNFLNNLTLGDSNQIYCVNTVTTAGYSSYHNTAVVTDTTFTSTYGILLGYETSANPTGTVNIASNLAALKTGVAVPATLYGCADRSTTQPHTIAVGDYNNFSGFSQDYNQLTVTSGSVHDLHVTPQFVDDSRNLATWDAARGSGTGTAAAAITYLLNINGYSSVTKTQSATPSARGVADLVSWVRDGYKVQNSSLNNAGHDGATIGAMDYESTASPNRMLLLGVGE